MSLRLTNVLIGLLFGLVALAISYVVALLVRVIFQKQIGTSKYYTAAIVVGFLVPVVLGALLPQSGSKEPGPTPIMRATGLDAPFIPPAEAELEKFPVQLNQAMEKLSPPEKAELSEAIGFLSYILAANLRDTAPSELERLSDSDLTAKWLTKLYRFAQTSGKDMTLRKYIELAAEARKQEPQWWSEYKASQPQAD